MLGFIPCSGKLLAHSGQVLCSTN